MAALQPERDLSRQPLFQVLFELELPQYERAPELLPVLLQALRLELVELCLQALL